MRYLVRRSKLLRAVVATGGPPRHLDDVTTELDAGHARGRVDLNHHQDLLVGAVGKAFEDHHVVGLGLEIDTHRVTQAGGEQALAGAVRIDFPDSSAFGMLGAAFIRVGAGADGQIKLGAVGIGDDIA